MHGPLELYLYFTSYLSEHLRQFILKRSHIINLRSIKSIKTPKPRSIKRVKEQHDDARTSVDEAIAIEHKNRSVSLLAVKARRETLQCSSLVEMKLFVSEREFFQGQQN